MLNLLIAKVEKGLCKSLDKALILLKGY